MSITDDTPEAVNLRTIYQALGGEREHDRWSSFKAELVERLVSELGNQTLPIQAKRDARTNPEKFMI